MNIDDRPTNDRPQGLLRHYEKISSGIITMQRVNRSPNPLHVWL